MAYAAQGLAAVTAATTTYSGAAPSTACHVPIWQRGPYDGSQPNSRLYIGDVKRFSDGVFANKQFTNLLKMQGGYEALHRAGVTSPNVVLAKMPNASNRAAAMVCTADGACPAGVFGTMSTDMWAPYAGVHTTTNNYQTTVTPGTPVGQFPNGVTLISSAGAGLPSGTFTASGNGNTSLAAAAVNTTGAYPTTGGVSLFDQMYEYGMFKDMPAIPATSNAPTMALAQAPLPPAYFPNSVPQPALQPGVNTGVSTVYQYANPVTVYNSGTGVAPFVAGQGFCPTCTGWS
jgi:hypothetical protein